MVKSIEKQRIWKKIEKIRRNIRSKVGSACTCSMRSFNAFNLLIATNGMLNKTYIICDYFSCSKKKPFGKIGIHLIGSLYIGQIENEMEPHYKCHLHKSIDFKIKIKNSTHHR